MKRLVLFLLAIGTASLFAQTPRNTTPQLENTKFELQQTLDKPTNVVANQAVRMGSKSNAKIGISSSANIYTMIVETTTCLTANQDLNAIMFTARGNPAAGLGVSAGSIHVSYSTNSGYSWKTIMATDDGIANRYPGGVIYNPAGNTDIENAYAVVSGSTTDASGWVETFWASVKLDSTGHHVSYEDKVTNPQDFPRYGMSAPGSGKIHVLGNKYEFVSGQGIQVWDPMTMNNGTFNATTGTFDWDRVLVNVPIANLSSMGNYHVSSYSTAWGPDGSVGYIWVLGIDSANPNTSYQPIVFKSTDYGVTWNKQPFYDFSNNTTITDTIWGTLADRTVKRPFFTSQMEAVVDHNGELHLFGVVKGAYSTHPDSLGYTFMFEPRHLYHIQTTPAGWEVDLVTSIYTLNVPAAESGYGVDQNAMGWDHRVQMARTADGTKIFGSWADSDTSFFTTVIAPNIMVWGKDLVNNTTYPVTDFTTGTVNEGMCYFHYVSDIALENAHGDIIIPVMFVDKGNTPLDPVYHYFLPRVGYGPTIGVQPVKKENPLSIISTYPNPVSDLANVRINLGEAASVNLEVYSITGQLVKQTSFGMLPAGEQTLQMDIQHLNSGMYIYTLQAGSHKATGKMLRK